MLIYNIKKTLRSLPRTDQRSAVREAVTIPESGLWLRVEVKPWLHVKSHYFEIILKLFRRFILTRKHREWLYAK